ncbi:MAG: DUF4031 domain-containing protein [Pseudomonadota bacterium]
MAVYVDNMVASHGRLKMCHMMASTPDELFEMAFEIGVSRRWLQHRATPAEHFDICMRKRRLAVEAGALECSSRDLGMLIRMRKGKSYDATCLTCRPQPVWCRPKRLL